MVHEWSIWYTNRHRYLTKNHTKTVVSKKWIDTISRHPFADDRVNSKRRASGSSVRIESETSKSSSTPVAEFASNDTYTGLDTVLFTFFNSVTPSVDLIPGDTFARELWKSKWRPSATASRSAQWHECSLFFALANRRAHSRHASSRCVRSTVSSSRRLQECRWGEECYMEKEKRRWLATNERQT